MSEAALACALLALDPEGLKGTLAVEGVGRKFSAALIKAQWLDGTSRVYTITAGQPTTFRVHAEDKDGKLSQLAQGAIGKNGGNQLFYFPTRDEPSTPASWGLKFETVDFKSAAAKPDKAGAAFDHEIQLVSYQLLMEAATGESPPSLDLVFLVKTKTPQVIRVQSPPADVHRKRRVTALLETAVEGIANSHHHPQPAMHCSWCQYRNECKAWLPGMTVEDIHRQRAA